MEAIGLLGKLFANGATGWTETEWHFVIFSCETQFPCLDILLPYQWLAKTIATIYVTKFESSYLSATCTQFSSRERND